jgi:uncharacterized repeat protein (TIGR03803 family)
MRQTTRRIALFFCFTLSLTVLSNIAQAQTETVLYIFSGGCGFSPFAGITFDQQGRIYGTTAYGGARSKGVVYRLAREGEGWICSPLHSFASQDQDGSTPLAGVVFGPDGLLYGTTQEGGAEGYGTVFSLQPPATACKSFLCPWLETILYSFTGGTDGAYPAYGNLVFDQAGNIYGTTYSGGSSDRGVVFKLTRSGSGWAESALWRVIGGEGGSPLGGVIFDSAGNLYGTTDQTVYELSPTQSGWSETTLYSFTDPANGGGAGGLIWDAHGDLFGITGGGPLGGNSAVYELRPQNGSWSFSVLQNFGSEYFAPLAPPTFDSQGNLYGPLPSYPSEGFGEIFELTPAGNQWIYSPFYQFPGGNGGAGPVGPVIFDANGNMYGTAAGVLGGPDTVWEITP